MQLEIVLHSHQQAWAAIKAQVFPLCADRPGVQGCHSKWDRGSLKTGDKPEIEATWCALTLGQLLKDLQQRGVRL